MHPLFSCDGDYVNSCCGMYELNGVQSTDTVELLMGFVEAMGHHEGYYDKHDNYVDPGFSQEYFDRGRPPFVLMSSNDGSGEKVAAYIKKRKLGPVWTSSTRPNPTGSTHLTMFVWEPDTKALWPWYLKTRKAFEKKKQDKQI